MFVCLATPHNFDHWVLRGGYLAGNLRAHTQVANCIRLSMRKAGMTQQAVSRPILVAPPQVSALLSFTFGVVVPVIVKLVMVGDNISYVVALAIVPWAALCMGVAHRLNRVLIRSLRLRLENKALTKQFQALVDQLTVCTLEAERANPA